MVVILVVGIGMLLALVSRQLSRRWFERANQVRHRRAASGVIVGAEPIEYRGDGDAGVLLLHGFGDTPQTLRGLAERLRANGYGVLAPLLPGHGRSLPEFVASSASQWLAEAHGALARIQSLHGRVGIAGLSMGGALATILASDDHAGVEALVLISPYMSTPRRIRRVARVHRLFDVLIPYLPGLGRRSIQDLHAAAESLAYGALSATALAQLVSIVDEANASLPRLTLPVLMLQSRDDNRIPADVGEQVFRRIGSNDKRIVWLMNSGHVITVDREHDRVEREIIEWLGKTLPVGAPTARP